MSTRTLTLIIALPLLAACTDSEPVAPTADDAASILAAKGGTPGKPRGGGDEGPEVTTTDLGTIEGTTNSAAIAVSDNGTYVVGTSGNRAIIVTPGDQMIELPVIFDSDPDLRRISRANDVDNTGQAVGSRWVDRVDVPSGRIAVFWDAGGQTGIELGDVNDRYGEALGINNSGVIVGRIWASRELDEDGNPLPETNHAMRWTVDVLGNVTQLDLHSAWVGQERRDDSFALDINDRGQILMRDNDVVGEHFLMDCGMPFDLASCTSIAIEPARVEYSAFAINNANPVQVAGGDWSSGLGVPLLSTVGGGSIELPLPNGFDAGYAKSLNDEGLVVGLVSGSKSGEVTAVLWKIDVDGSATVFVLDNGVAEDLANSGMGIGELARVVGQGKGNKSRGKTPNVARMWELTVPQG